MSAVAAALRRKYPVVTADEAARFVHHCAMGAKQSEIDDVVTRGYAVWLDEQLAMAAPDMQNPHTNYPPLTSGQIEGCQESFGNFLFNSPAQVRMRAIDALSQFFVLNELKIGGDWVHKRIWLQLLNTSAFGNFRDLLEAVSKSAHMGSYLSSRNNGKATATTQPDENYAREVMQLFSIGLWELFPNGERKKTGDLPVNDPRYVLNGTADVPTYNLADVRGMARVFTGWGSGPSPITGTGGGWNANEVDSVNGPMIQYPAYHETGTKEFLGVTIPVDTLGQASLTIAMDTLFNHANTAPFFCKQMIQRLTTSNPTPEYVARVASAFLDNGSGVRGDLRAVWRAILRDQEAMSIYTAQLPTWGRVREPHRAFYGRYRGLGASPRSPSGYCHMRYEQRRAERIGQVPFDSPSVFNFYLPEFQPAGEIAALGMKAPELQVLGEGTLTHLFNYRPPLDNDFDKVGFDSSANAEPDATTVTITDWQAQATSDVPGMVDRMIRLVSGAPMPAATRTEMITRASAVSAGDWKYRFVVALSILTNNPSYWVQR